MELFQHPSKCRTVILQERLTRCLLSNLMHLQSKLFILKKKGGRGKEFRGSDKILKVCTSRISISHSSRKKKTFILIKMMCVWLEKKPDSEAKCLNIFIYSVLCNRRLLKIPFAQTPLPQINNRQNKSSRLPCRNGPSIA